MTEKKQEERVKQGQMGCGTSLLVLITIVGSILIVSGDKYSSKPETFTSEVISQKTTPAGEKYDLVKDSDDFGKYKDVFLEAANTLIKERRCSAAEFKEQGGWLLSSNYKPRDVYFIWCNNNRVRVYLDAQTARIW